MSDPIVNSVSGNPKVVVVDSNKQEASAAKAETSGSIFITTNQIYEIAKSLYKSGTDLNSTAVHKLIVGMLDRLEPEDKNRIKASLESNNIKEVVSILKDYRPPFGLEGVDKAQNAEKSISPDDKEKIRKIIVELLRSCAGGPKEALEYAESMNKDLDLAEVTKNIAGGPQKVIDPVGISESIGISKIAKNVAGGPKNVIDTEKIGVVSSKLKEMLALAADNPEYIKGVLNEEINKMDNPKMIESLHSNPAFLMENMEKI